MGTGSECLTHFVTHRKPLCSPWLLPGCCSCSPGGEGSWFEQSHQYPLESQAQPVPEVCLSHFPPLGLCVDHFCFPDGFSLLLHSWNMSPFPPTAPLASSQWGLPKGLGTHHSGRQVITVRVGTELGLLLSGSGCGFCSTGPRVERAEEEEEAGTDWACPQVLSRIS